MTDKETRQQLPSPEGKPYNISSEDLSVIVNKYKLISNAKAREIFGKNKTIDKYYIKRMPPP